MDVYETAVKMGVIKSDDISEEAFKKFLYFSRSFEPNVADTLSIFISLATDNAKELALAKMNGRPELLSLPLAMITYGMHIDDVINICVNLMNTIAKDLDSSKFSLIKLDTNDIKKLIQKHA